ncbi:MAG: hypothetical protein Q7S85_00990 [Rugosibacter sp.]|nr:hypothetical protein [Rugosibacter sp.]
MLTLIVPGLIWPHQALLDLTCGLELPAFTTLLGYGRVTRSAQSSAYDALAKSLGLPCPLPVAALRAQAGGYATQTDDWLCLDPVNLQLNKDRVVVGNPETLALTELEAHQLAAALAPTFSAFGEMKVLTSTHWILQLAAASRSATDTAPALPNFTPLPGVIGRSAAPLPSGAAYRPWHAALNEAQMTLHSHPVNQARAAANRPVVNSLWPWGGGRLSRLLTPQLAAPGGIACERIIASDLVAQGAARFFDVPAEPLPGQYPGPNAATDMRSALVMYDSLDTPARSGDALVWQEALHTLETGWLTPLLAELRAGRLDALRLIAPGETHSCEITLSRRQLWQFWRRPAPLTVLATS